MAGCWFWARSNAWQNVRHRALKVRSQYYAMHVVQNCFFLLYYRQQEQEQEICKNVSISNGDLFHTETVKMSSLPTKKLFECFGIQSEKGKRIDLFTNVFWAKIFHDDLFVILTKKRQLLLSIDGINFSACGPMKDLNKGIVFFPMIFASFKS